MENPQQDSRIQEVAFPTFSLFPTEIRECIWTHALPEPRIIYVERHAKLAEPSDSIQHQAQDVPEDHLPEPTYFKSASPNGSIPSLLRTCKESYAVVIRNYSVIFPSSSTWFSFSTDFLYLDWGLRCYDNIMTYNPDHFTTSSASGISSGPFDLLDLRGYGLPLTPPSLFAPPKISMDLAKKVKNLAVYIPYSSFNVEEWLVRYLLRYFSGVTLLVMVNPLHLMKEVVVGQELVWLKDRMGDDDLFANENRKENGGVQYGPEPIRSFNLGLRDLIIQRDDGQYDWCAPVARKSFEDTWAENHTASEGFEMPTILFKTITTAPVKERLLEICGSEDGFQKLMGLHWRFVKGTTEYSGPLDLSQQIAFFRLGQERLKETLAEYKDERFVSGDAHYHQAMLGILRVENQALHRRLKEAEVRLAAHDV